ncbi:MAG: CBS domain-containing protein [Thermoplasmataceae archaeon]|jgi:CBS domain-containing protein|nr:CBS domain-containing protein [Candidatus Thermoplasmatota archaeon]
MVLYAKDIMKEYTNMLGEDTTALEASKIMSNDRVGFVVVKDKEGKPFGMVTEWDYINKIISKGVDPSRITMKELMVTPIISVDPKTPTDKITVMMSKHGIRRIPVIENGKLVGVITSRDIIRIFKDYMDNLSDVIARFGTF